MTASDAGRRQFSGHPVPPRSRARGRTVAALAILIGCLIPAGPVRADTARADPAAGQPPGTVFRDCRDDCPALVVVPPGSFLMGAAPGEEAGAGLPDHLHGHAAPQHAVVIPAALAVSVAEISTDDWLSCLARGGCSGYRPPMPWGNGSGPVLFVSWLQAQDYLRWLRAATGQPYRLLTEAEWEYVARASTTTARPWGEAAGTGHANCTGCGPTPEPVSPNDPDRFPANRFGLRNLLGNAWEWVEDCYRPDYRDAANTGTATVWAGCRDRVLRGGAWTSEPWAVRSAMRARFPADRSFVDIGFRVVRPIAAPP